MKITKEQKLFYGLSLGLFFGSVLLFDAIGRLTYRNETIFEAIKETLYYLTVQPIGTAMLLAPYLILGFVSAKAAKNNNIKKGMCFFVSGLISLSYIYYSGYLAASYYMELKKWTASSLSVGMLPFQSIIALPIGLFFGWVIYELTKENKPNK